MDLEPSVILTTETKRKRGVKNGDILGFCVTHRRTTAAFMLI